MFYYGCDSSGSTILDDNNHHHDNLPVENVIVTSNLTDTSSNNSLDFDQLYRSKKPNSSKLSEVKVDGDDIDNDIHNDIHNHNNNHFDFLHNSDELFHQKWLTALEESDIFVEKDRIISFEFHQQCLRLQDFFNRILIEHVDFNSLGINEVKKEFIDQWSYRYLTSFYHIDQYNQQKFDQQFEYFIDNIIDSNSITDCSALASYQSKFDQLLSFYGDYDLWNDKTFDLEFSKHFSFSLSEDSQMAKSFLGGVHQYYQYFQIEDYLTSTDSQDESKYTDIEYKWRSSFFKTLNHFSTVSSHDPIVLNYQDNKNIAQVVGTDMFWSLKDSIVLNKLDNHYLNVQNSHGLLVKDHILSVTDNKSNSFLKTGVDESEKIIQSLFSEGEKTIEVLRKNHATSALQNTKVFFDINHYLTNSTKVSSSVHKLALTSTDHINNVAVIKIKSFYYHQTKDDYPEVSEDVLMHLNSLVSTKDPDVIVLDLTDNFFGHFDQAIKLHELLSYNKQSITKVSYFDSQGHQHEVLEQTPKLYLNKPFVVMVNKNTKGAAELFVDLFSNNNQVLVVGVDNKTYGQGSVFKEILLAGSEQINLSSLSFQVPVKRYLRSDGLSFNCGVRIDLVIYQNVNKYDSFDNCNKVLDNYTSDNTQFNSQSIIPKLTSKNIIRSQIDQDHRNQKKIKDNAFFEVLMIAADYYNILHDNPYGLYKLISSSDNDSLDHNFLSDKNIADQIDSIDLEFDHYTSSLIVSQKPLYQLIFEEHIDLDNNIAGYKTKVCLIETIDNQQNVTNCVDAFSSIDNQSFIISAQKLSNYNYEQIVSDQKEILDQHLINEEIQRLFLSAYGVGLIAGSFTGVTDLSFTLLGGIAGVTVFDAVKDASAGVPAKVNKQIGIPTAAFITSIGSILGSATSIVSIYQLKKRLSFMTNSYFGKIAAVVFLLIGIKFAFFSDQHQIKPGSNDPIARLSAMILDPVSNELGEKLPDLFNYQPVYFNNISEAMLAVNSLRKIFVQRSIAKPSDLSLVCVDIGHCKIYDHD